MAETIEFDAVHEYNIFKSGIVVDVVIRSGERLVDLDARIDTGSTYCIFERQFGERLGLRIEEGLLVEMGTVTGSFRVYGHELELTVLGVPTFSTIYFAESEHFDRNVLGRVGWLDRVKIGLIESEGKLYLSRYQ